MHNTTSVVYETSLLHLIKSCYLYRDLIWQLTKRNIQMKYKGSFLGIIWSVIQPLIQLFIYTFAFSFVFKAKWGIKDENHFDFALILFASLTVFNLLADTIRESPYLILNNESYVKKVVFPLEVLPIANLLSVFLNTVISILVFSFIYSITTSNSLPTSILILPVILIPLGIIALSFSYIVSSICIYFRDFSHIVGNILTILLFVSPVFYSLNRIPEKYHYLMLLNPLTHILDSSRKVMIFGGFPNLDNMIIYWILSILSLNLGFWYFQKTRVSFSDLI